MGNPEVTKIEHIIFLFQIRICMGKTKFWFTNLEKKEFLENNKMLLHIL